MKSVSQVFYAYTPTRSSAPFFHSVVAFFSLLHTSPAIMTGKRHAELEVGKKHPSLRSYVLFLMDLSKVEMVEAKRICNSRFSAIKEESRHGVK